MPDMLAFQTTVADPPDHRPSSAGLTVEDVARRYRVSPDKVRGWINSGELRAINTAARLCAKPRFVVTWEALAEFEKARQAGPPATAKPQRRRRTNGIDFYPDD